MQRCCTCKLASRKETSVHNVQVSMIIRVSKRTAAQLSPNLKASEAHIGHHSAYNLMVTVAHGMLEPLQQSCKCMWCVLI